jgi:hypothetical protein
MRKVTGRGAVHTLLHSRLHARYVVIRHSNGGASVFTTMPRGYAAAVSGAELEARLRAEVTPSADTPVSAPWGYSLGREWFVSDETELIDNCV